MGRASNIVRSLFALVVFGAMTSPARACTVCYGESESAVIVGAQQATVLMVGLTYFLLGGGAVAFVVLRRRSIKRQDESADPSENGGEAPR